MNLTKRQQEILRHFIIHENALSYTEIASLFRIGISTARKDIRFISVYLSDEFHINFRKDSFNHIFLSKEDTQTIMRAKLPMTISMNPHTKSRMLLLIYHLLLSKSHTLSMQKLADILFVSRPTAYHLLDSAECILSEHGITIHKGSPGGLLVSCRENSWREAAATLYQQLKKYGFVINYQQIKVAAASADVVGCDILAGMFPGLPIHRIAALLLDFEKQEGIRIMDYSFEWLCVYTSIIMYRAGSSKSTEPLTASFLSDYKEYAAYRLSQKYIELLENSFPLRLPPEERDYVTALFLSSSIEYLKLNYNNGYVSPSIREFVEQLVERSGNMMGRHIIHDKRLYEALLNYIPIMVHRLRFKFRPPQCPYDVMKKSYSKIFAVIWSMNILFNHYFQIELNREESCCLVFYFAAAMERAANHLRAVIVWKSEAGQGEVDLLTSAIEKKFPNISIADILPFHEFTAKSYHTAGFDLIISNCPLEMTGKPVLLVNSILTPEDIEAINHKMLEIKDKEMHNPKTKLSVEYLLHPEHIFTRIAKDTKNNILKLLCRQLELSDYATAQFYETVLYRESQCSTYIGNGLIFTHGSSDQVIRSALAIASLSSPIYCDDVNVDLVFIYAVHLDDLRDNKIEIEDFFARFIDIAQDCDLLQKLRAETQPEGFHQTFLSFF